MMSSVRSRVTRPTSTVTLAARQGAADGALMRTAAVARGEFGEAEVSALVADSLAFDAGGGVAEGDEGAEEIAGDARDLSGDGASGV